MKAWRITFFVCSFQKKNIYKTAVEVSLRTSVRTMQSVKEIVSQRGKVMLLVDNYK